VAKSAEDIYRRHIQSLPAEERARLVALTSLGLEADVCDRKAMRRIGELHGLGRVGKEVVLGILERGSEKGKSRMRAKVIPDTTQDTLHAEVRANVVNGSKVYTDAHQGYRGLSADLEHSWVDHLVRYAEGAVHTNGCENFWALFTRMLNGTYVHVDPRHLQSYVDEEAHRFSNRKADDGTRFLSTMRGMEGRRLMYRELTERGLTMLAPSQPSDAR
jgi:hypothetical protein